MANNIERAKSHTFGGFYGRLDIYSSLDVITDENVIKAVNEALFWHSRNMWEETELLWYRRGVQPILSREKTRNNFVNNKAVVNYAESFTTFKNGYFLTQPCSYIARKDEAQEKVRELNEYLYLSGKQQADNDVVNWFHTVGKGCLLVEPGDTDDKPVVAYALDPTQAFVVYSIRPGHKPLFGVNAVQVNDKLFVDVYTADKYYRMYGMGKIETTTKAEWPVLPTVQNIVEVKANMIGKVPMIEYRYNAENMAVIEPGIPLQNALNTLLSNRLDGVEQFIQSLMVIYNAELPEGETALSLKESGLLMLKSTDDNGKARIEILAEQLDQSQTQTLVDNVQNDLFTICKVPIVRYGMKSTSDTGAAALSRDGWYQADNDARNTEDEFRRSNRYFDEIFCEILRRKKLLEISPSEFELQFVRNETANVVSKSQALMNLLSAGMAPTLAFAKSGISNDPLNDVALSEPWLKLKWGNPEATDEEGEEGMDDTAPKKTEANYVKGYYRS